MSGRGQVAARAEEIFTRAGAYRAGHFELKSGLHADRYVEKFAVLQWPAAVSELCRLMIERAAAQVDVTLGPTTGGVILAYETARQLGVRGIFAEQVAGPDGVPRRALRRGFALARGERVLLVDDVVTTGASLVEMLPLVEEVGAELVGVAVLVDRSGGLGEVVSPATGRRYAVDALWSLSLPTYQPGAPSCPGCAAGMRLDKPGATGAPVRAADS
ncbi:MAG: orotate phosphoribosyltransferase [Chloroflexota bacterium]|nr:orotate phosphoribosyltransferase [Chloroflexota bacterium]